MKRLLGDIWFNDEYGTWCVLDIRGVLFCDSFADCLVVSKKYTKYKRQKKSSNKMRQALKERNNQKWPKKVV